MSASLALSALSAKTSPLFGKKLKGEHEMTNPFISLEKAAENMHQGAGPGFLQQAAGAWGVVAQKLETAAEEMLSVITWCEGQYWQSPAAQQMREALTSVTQRLKNNAVVAGQIETAATTVTVAFDKAQAATPTPQHVEANRQMRELLAAKNRLGLYQSKIAELDAAYQDMWLECIVANDRYYYDTSYALERVKQTWWSPHQQPAGAPTTTEDHPPTPDVPNIPAQITQYNAPAAAWARFYALDHTIRITGHQKEYEQHSTDAKMYKGLADHGTATAKLCNEMAQHHQQAAQFHKDLPLSQTDIPTLAHKYVDIATTWKQTQQQIQKTIAAHHAAGITQPHLRKMENSLSAIKKDFTDGMEELFTIHNLDLVKPDLNSYTNSLQRLSEQITNDIEAQEEVGLHEQNADIYAHVAEGIQSWALNHAEEAGNAGRAARQHAQSMTDHAHDFFVFFQMAARADNQATTPAGSSA